MSVSHCHIVLTDWLMPEMDGLALCRHVRINEDDAYVYGLMLTVRESKEDMLMGLAAGADDYVANSASIDEILARLESAGALPTCASRCPVASGRIVTPPSQTLHPARTIYSIF